MITVSEEGNEVVRSSVMSLHAVIHVWSKWQQFSLKLFLLIISPFPPIVPSADKLFMLSLLRG